MNGSIAQLVEQVTLNHWVVGSNPSAPTICVTDVRGRVAQLVEQRTENSCVVGSIPTPATTQNFQNPPIKRDFLLHIAENYAKKREKLQKPFFPCFPLF